MAFKRRKQLQQGGGEDTMDYSFISFIEKTGCVDTHGHRLYGTAALLYILHKPVRSISKCEIETGKAFVQRYLNGVA